jgi:periplasmic protein TonB
MENVLAAQSWQSKQSVKGWSASLVLHACLAAAAFGLLPKMAVIVQEEPFKWDVVMVEPAPETVRPEEPAPAPKIQPAPPVKPQPARTVQPPPQPQQRQVETRVAPQPVQREVQPVLETVRPQQQIQPPQEVVRVQPEQGKPQEIHKPEPLVQATTPAEVKREVAPAVEQTVVESAPVAAQTYAAQPFISAPPVIETRSEPVATASASVVHAIPAAEAVPATPAPADAAPAPVAEAVASVASEPVAAPPAPVSTAQPDPAKMEEHQVVASAVMPKAASKSDYKWVADSLTRRVIELRHYPSTAKLNGWEGKVVLKVSIGPDGHLKGVEVVESSGHESLDQAAIEVVRRACPLHMKHEVTAPLVVMKLPVVYKLSR